MDNLLEFDSAVHYFDYNLHFFPSALAGLINSRVIAAQCFYNDLIHLYRSITIDIALKNKEHDRHINERLTIYFIRVKTLCSAVNNHERKLHHSRQLGNVV